MKNRALAVDQTSCTQCAFKVATNLSGWRNVLSREGLQRNYNKNTAVILHQWGIGNLLEQKAAHQKFLNEHVVWWTEVI